MNFSISPLIVPVAAAAYWGGYGREFLLACTVMILHETAHLVAALCIGLKPEKFELTPFGAHMTLRTKMVGSAAEEIILYGAGPLLNGIFALAAAVAGYAEIYRLNFALMVMNLLPATPLDGGMILRRILSDKLGCTAAIKITRTVSVAAASAFALLFLWGTRHGITNPSALFAALFLTGSAFTAEPLYPGSLAAAMTHKAKRHNSVKVVAVDDSHTYAEAARQISPSYTLLTAVIKDGEVREIIGENKLIDRAVACP